ncbi:MAG: SulP family inorganic anion transporter [Planctomycetaceae bacterium]|nr:SulP family inorganic anion transporter [Planctomycetaceae bacterium]
MPSANKHSDDNQNSGKLAHVRQDFMASLVVFLVALPLCMGIAIASGVPVSAGLITGIVAGIVVGVLAGCPLQVSGPAAGLTVVVYEAVSRHGLEMLGLIVLMAGLMQIIAGTLRMGQWFRAVSPAVVNGMLAGIGVLIFASQFHVMLDDVPKGSGIENLVTIPQAIQKAVRSPQIPERGRRHRHREALLQLGELHRQQEVIHEKLAERLPNHQEPTPEPPEIETEDLITRQESLIADTQAFVQGSLSFFEDQPERKATLQEAEEMAVRTMTLSLNLLQSSDPSRALHLEEEASEALLAIQGVFKNHELAAAVGIITILALILWTAFAKGKIGIIPGPLVAVIVGTVVATIWELPVLYVEIPDSMTEELHLVTPAVLADAPWEALFGSAVLMAIIASAETLLCANAVDQLHTGARTRYDKELFAQGVGNVICGVLGALPMTGVIVRSSANMQAGGKTRLSAILHGIWLLVFVVFLGTLLRMIPTAALAAILVYTGYKLCDWRKVRTLAHYGWGEVAIYFVTVIVIVVEDLLTGVVVGLLLAIGKLVHSVAQLHVTVDKSKDDAVWVRLNGAGTFVRLPKLASKLEQIPPGRKVHFDFKELSYLDHACLTLLTSWANQHEATGGEVIVDWEDLREFVRSGHHLRKARTGADEARAELNEDARETAGTSSR